MTTSIQNRDRTYYEIAETLPLKRKRVMMKILMLGTATQKDVAKELNVSLHEITGRFSELEKLYLIKQVGTRDGARPQTVYAPITDPTERAMAIAAESLDMDNLLDHITDDLEKVATLQLSENLKHILNKEYKRVLKRIKKLKEISI